MKNAAEYIQETLQSLLNQTFTNFEIIVVNDGSEDNSQALVESFSDNRIQLIQGQSKGISAALNLALDNANGEYVCRCDADDLYPTERLQIQVDYLQANPEYSAVAGKFCSMDEKSQPVSEFQTGNETCEITTELLVGKTRTHLGTFLMQLKKVQELGGFREYFVTAEDIDLQLRLAECGRVAYLPKNMYFYRIHNSSITHVQSANQRVFYEKTAREFLQQRLVEGADLLEQGKAITPPASSQAPSDSSAQITGYLISEAWRLHAAKQKKAALKLGLRACKKRPLDWRVWKSTVMLLLRS